MSSGNILYFNGQRFELSEIFFRTPSEHTIKGSHFDLEIQFVHLDNKKQKLMLAVFANEGNLNKSIESILDSFPRKGQGKREVVDFNLQTLLPRRRGYYSYLGSETFPPCHQGVQWVLLDTPISVSARQIDQFESHFGKNIRPTQGLYMRVPVRKR